MRRVSRVVVFVFLFCVASAFGKGMEECDQAIINSVVVKLKNVLKNTPVDSISCSALGLFKITSGDNSFFTDKEGRFLFFGSIYDLKGSREVASSYNEKEAVSSSLQVDWSKLPLTDAVTLERGKQEVAVYIDINCPHCRREFMALQTMKDIKVHYMLTSVFGERSRLDSSTILCSMDRVGALTTYMEKRRLPAGAAACTAGTKALSRITAFGTSKGWRGTPVTVRKDGKVMVGFKDKASLRAFIEGEGEDNGR